MSTATIELSSTRRALFEVLGDNQQQYLDYIKNWFRKRCTKEEFDSAARKLLTPESVHLHNQFLLAVLNKCQTLVNISPCPPLAKLETQSPNIPELLSPSKFDVPDRLKKGKIKRKSKPNRASLEHRFQPVSVPQCAPEVTLPASLAPEESSLQLCAREQLLPDIGLVHGRLLVAAWEEGLEGVEVRQTSHRKKYNCFCLISYFAFPVFYLQNIVLPFFHPGVSRAARSGGG